jgi:hypothetical protein
VISAEGEAQILEQQKKVRGKTIAFMLSLKDVLKGMSRDGDILPDRAQDIYNHMKKITMQDGSIKKGDLADYRI